MKRLGWWIAAALTGLILAAVFVAYLQPGLILDFFNLRYCA